MIRFRCFAHAILMNLVGFFLDVVAFTGLEVTAAVRLDDEDRETPSSVPYPGASLMLIGMLAMAELNSGDIAAPLKYE